jgi:DNA-binding response OmpR family regulator
MTPREADVAFVLEGVPGVLEVAALQGASTFAFAVRVESAHALAQAHYQLLRVLPHQECRSVYAYETELPAALRARATRLALSERERAEARARVPATSKALEQERHAPRPVGLASVGFRVLLVADDVESWRAVLAALGMGTERIIEPDVESALALCRGRAFDLIVCCASRAFGRRGFVTALAAENPGATADVVIVARAGQRELAISSLDTLCVWCSVLTRPVDPDDLRELLRVRASSDPFPVPILRPRQDRRRAPRPSVAPHVVLFDDDPAPPDLGAALAAEGVELTSPSTPWELLDALESGHVDLVLASATAKTPDGVPVYRFAWRARPADASRFVFLARSAPPAAREGSILVRPITAQGIMGLLRARGVAI